MNLLEINNDLLNKIFKLYLKSKCLLYYCNLKLVCKHFDNVFCNMINTSNFNKFNFEGINFDKLSKIEKDSFKSDNSFRNKKIFIETQNKLRNIKLSSYYYIRSKKYNINFCKICFYRSCEFMPFYFIYGDEGKILCEIKQEKTKRFSDKRNHYYFSNLNNFEYIVF